MTPFVVAQRPPKLKCGILGPGYTYGLLIHRRVGLGDPNLAATECVQQAVYRFFRGLGIVFGKHTQCGTAIALFQHGPSDHRSCPEPLD